MTPKQRRFINEYAIDGNATQAAIRAGYSEKTARSAGQRLLTNVDISIGIAKRETSIAEKAGISQQWVLDRLKANYDRAMEAEAQTNADGTAVAFRYEGGVANRALELIGKHLGMFPDRVVVDDPSKLSDEELATKADDARRKLKLA